MAEREEISRGVAAGETCRGSNENTNGLLRQYLPKRTDLKVHTQAELDAIALELNARPRKTHEFMTPSQKYAEAVALTP